MDDSGALQGRVALVTGGGGGPGRAEVDTDDASRHEPNVPRRARQRRSS